MVEPRFGPGSRVRTTDIDPDHHTRLPRYARAKVGEVIENQGVWPVADDVARRLEPRMEPVYTVRFAGRDLWGTGDHDVTVDLWESYLDSAAVEGEP
jgi:hypothetical protein